MNKTVASWAERSGVELLWPELFAAVRTEGSFLSLAEAYDFQTNPCIDYGKFIERIPLFVLRPSTLHQLVASVAFLNEASIQYKVRGAAHSAGGQVLFDKGAVIDLARLTRVVEDLPEIEQIVVEGGIWWLQLAEYLHFQGRRPVALTDNLRTTVAGTLAVGGFGDTTHLYGLQIASVTELTLVTPDARISRVAPSETLFGYVLAGRGQLGIIAEARLRTLRRPPTLATRLLQWNSVPDFVEDATRMIETELYEFSRMRLHFRPEWRHRNLVTGLAGNFRDEIPANDQSSPILRHAQVQPYQKIDFLQHYSQDATENWRLCSPAVEMIFPLPNGLKVWEQINRQVLQSGLFQCLDRGSSIMILRGDRRFPLAPLPDTEFCMMIALRPAMALRAVQEYLPLLHRIQAQALEAGAKIYMMSIESDHPSFLNLQFGPALPEFLALKQELDPNRLLNPGLL